MKPNVVVDEMFPEGAGSYMDLDEVRFFKLTHDNLVVYTLAFVRHDLKCKGLFLHFFLPNYMLPLV